MLRKFCTGLGWFSTGRVRNFWSARGMFSAQHRAFKLARVTLGSARVTLVLHGSSSILHGSCNFPSSEVGNLIFSQYSGLFCFENLNWINLKILLMNLDELRT